MILKSEATQLEALIHSVLQNYFPNPVSGAITLKPHKHLLKTNFFIIRCHKIHQSILLLYVILFT